MWLFPATVWTRYLCGWRWETFVFFRFCKMWKPWKAKKTEKLKVTSLRLTAWPTSPTWRDRSVRWSRPVEVRGSIARRPAVVPVCSDLFHVPWKRDISDVQFTQWFPKNEMGMCSYYSRGQKCTTTVLFWSFPARKSRLLQSDAMGPQRPAQPTVPRPLSSNDHLKSFHHSFRSQSK